MKKLYVSLMVVLAMLVVAGVNDAPGLAKADVGIRANGTSAAVTIIVTPKKVGTVTNTVEVSSLSSDPNLANNADTEETTVVAH